MASLVGEDYTSLGEVIKAPQAGKAPSSLAGGGMGQSGGGTPSTGAPPGTTVADAPIGGASGLGGSVGIGGGTGTGTQGAKTLRTFLAEQNGLGPGGQIPGSDTQGSPTPGWGYSWQQAGQVGSLANGGNNAYVNPERVAYLESVRGTGAFSDAMDKIRTDALRGAVGGTFAAPRTVVDQDLQQIMQQYGNPFTTADVATLAYAGDPWAMRTIAGYPQIRGLASGNTSPDQAAQFLVQQGINPIQARGIVDFVRTNPATVPAILGQQATGEWVRDQAGQTQWRPYTAGEMGVSQFVDPNTSGQMVQAAGRLLNANVAGGQVSAVLSKMLNVDKMSPDQVYQTMVNDYRVMPDLARTAIGLMGHRVTAAAPAPGTTGGGSPSTPTTTGGAPSTGGGVQPGGGAPTTPKPGTGSPTGDLTTTPQNRQWVTDTALQVLGRPHGSGTVGSAIREAAAKGVTTESMMADLTGQYRLPPELATALIEGALGQGAQATQQGQGQIGASTGSGPMTGANAGVAGRSAEVLGNGLTPNPKGSQLSLTTGLSGRRYATDEFGNMTPTAGTPGLAGQALLSQAGRAPQTIAPVGDAEAAAMLRSGEVSLPQAREILTTLGMAPAMQDAYLARLGVGG